MLESMFRQLLLSMHAVVKVGNNRISSKRSQLGLSDSGDSSEVVVYIKYERIEMSSRQCAKSHVGFNLTEINTALAANQLWFVQLALAITGR